MSSKMTESRQDVQGDELHRLIEFVTKNTYKAKDIDSKNEAILATSLKLIGRDYKFSTVNNSNGELCSHYPARIPILEYLLSESGKPPDSVESLYDVTKLKDLFHKAKMARCRSRFVVPVILYEGKHICRSATISGGAEIYGRSGLDFFLGGEPQQPMELAPEPTSSEWQPFNRIRGSDIKLLKSLSVGFICDLMVEKKKVKFGMPVTSSEKVDKEHRYSDFSIVCIPYPGCEFFKEWRENSYQADGLLFDWNQAYADALLDLPNRPLPPKSVDWSKYRSWDLAKLTQNYLLLLLHYIKEADTGLLVHCISGWDRTPLFVSLLRLSLWADGVIHPSLSPLEILYLTISFDWYLYGHNFPERINKGEEIFFFCFNFLKYITNDEFSVHKRKPNSRTVSRTDSECNIDGVLLDPELNKSAYKGSNTSINSTSSLNSTKSSVDNAPIYFTPHSLEEDTFMSMPNGSSGNAYSVRNANPPAAAITCRSQQLQYSSTSPMAVPISVHRMQETRANSPACGSWQIISGTGSVKGSMSSHESPRSSTSGSHGSHSTHSSNCCEYHESHEDSPRKQRLDAIRQIFLSTYSSLLDSHHNGLGASTSEGNSSGIGGLLENFAEKVGFRMPRSTAV